jgi:hypothetical protein
MSSGLSEDDRRRIETFCETPPYERSPEDLRPETEYADDVPAPDESERSLLGAVLHRLRR